MNNNNRKKYLSASIVFYDKLKARILDYRTKNYGTDVKDEDFSYNFDIWGGEPLFGKFKEFKELTTWLKKEFNNCDLFVSTNGLISQPHTICVPNPTIFKKAMCWIFIFGIQNHAKRI